LIDKKASGKDPNRLSYRKSNHCISKRNQKLIGRYLTTRQLDIKELGLVLPTFIGAPSTLLLIELFAAMLAELPVPILSGPSENEGSREGRPINMRDRD
jgi:hypothetical protein